MDTSDSNGAILCIIDLDEDFVLLPFNFCRKCFQYRQKCIILGEYVVSKESFQSYKGLVRAVRVACNCHTNDDQESRLLKSRGEGHFGFHWIICRQVLRRRNKRLSSFFEYREIEPWKYEYFDKYIKGTDDIKSSYAKLETTSYSSAKNDFIFKIPIESYEASKCQILAIISLTSYTHFSVIW